MKKVYVALSGGVDSSVTAALLQERGYDVHGVFIRAWQADFLPCSQDEEEKWAKRVAAHLGIPFATLDLSEEYKRDIVDPMIAAYTEGRTPNPDVLCNRYIKFGPFREWALQQGAEYIATGHHARVAVSSSGLTSLLRGIDPAKDQAYFLWMLTQEDLRCTLMPVGEMHKDDVRAYATKLQLPSAKKKDSQGLCFLGDVEMRDFLRHFIEVSKGSVLNTDGAVIGKHDGALLYTLGQRSHFSLHEEDAARSAHYVVSKDLSANTITVDTSPEGTNVVPNTVTKLHLTEVNWIDASPLHEKSYQCEIRYHGTPHECTVELTESAMATVTLAKGIPPVAAGQSVVIYDADVVLGGGIMVE